MPAFTFTVTVASADGVASAKMTIPVRAAVGPSLAPATLAPATIGVEYSAQIAATGDGALTFDTTSVLPPGLRLRPSGLVFGTPLPTTQASYDLRVRVTSDSAAGSSLAVITLPIANPFSAPVITSGPPAAGIVGTPYAFSVVATGTPLPSYSVSAGALPRGLAMDPASGLISGTPLEAGTATVTISATNSVGTATTEFSLSVAPAVSVTPPATTSPSTGGGSSAQAMTGSGGQGTTGSGARGTGGSAARGEQGSQLAETGASSLAGSLTGWAGLSLVLMGLAGAGLPGIRGRKRSRQVRHG